MQDLPAELLRHIFGFIGPSELFPNCFLISKRCLAIVTDELAWQQRCCADLGVDEKVEGVDSWLDTYKGLLFFFLCLKIRTPLLTMYPFTTQKKIRIPLSVGSEHQDPTPRTAKASEATN